MRRKHTQGEIDWIDGQVCDYRCGLCDFHYTGTLADWRAIRAAHRADAHPGWKPRKRTLIGAGSRARVKVLTEREMQAGVAP